MRTSQRSQVSPFPVFIALWVVLGILGLVLNVLRTQRAALSNGQSDVLCNGVCGCGGCGPEYWVALFALLIVVAGVGRLVHIYGGGR